LHQRIERDLLHPWPNIPLKIKRGNPIMLRVLPSSNRPLMMCIGLATLTPRLPAVRGIDALLPQRRQHLRSVRYERFGELQPSLRQTVIAVLALG
jgi:hypothetical protein